METNENIKDAVTFNSNFREFTGEEILTLNEKERKEYFKILSVFLTKKYSDNRNEMDKLVEEIHKDFEELDKKYGVS